MELAQQLRWNDFIKSCTRRDLLAEWVNALEHCERWTEAHPGPALTEPVARALQAMLSGYQLLRPLIDDVAHCDEPASPELVNVIFGLARKVRRDVPRVEGADHVARP